MKEEGEITDDDDDKSVARVTEVTVPENQLRRHKRKRGDDPRRRSVSIRRDMQRSYDFQKSRDCALSNVRHATVPALMDLTVSATKRTVPDFKGRPVSRASVPPATSNFTHLRSPLLPLPSCPQSQPTLSPVAENISSECELQEKNQKSQTSDSYIVIDSNDTEVITINDSDTDVIDDMEIIVSEISSPIVSKMKQEDEDLDELQLRRDALDSAVKSNKTQNKMCVPFGGDSCSSSNSERLHSSNICLNSFTQNLPDLQSDNASVQSSADKTLCASDSTGVSGVVIPVTTSSYNQLACDKSCLSDYTALSASSQQSNTVSFNLLSADVHSLAVTDSTYINSNVTRNQELPVSQDVQQSDVDNYDEVEMDLDSGSDSESHVANSCEHLLQPSACMSNTPDENFPQNQYTCTSQVNFESSATATYTEPLVKPLCTSNSFDSAVSWSSVPCPSTDGNSTAATNQVSEGPLACTIYDDKVPVVLHPKTEIMESCSSDNLQQQRKVKDADKKSELLLRAAVLQSLSSKRQQQQLQSQLDTVSCVTRDKVKATKLEVTAQSTKRTVTPTSSNQLTVQLPQLPVHQPVVIKLTGESSDSDDMEQLEVVDSFDHSSTVASSCSLGMSSNLDRLLREIRIATEGPKSEDCDIAPSRQIENASAVKYHEKRNASESEPAVANQFMLPNNAVSSLPFLTYNKTLLMKTAVPVMSFNKGLVNSAPLDRTDNSLQKIALCNLKREISCKRRKLQQQKVALSKTKLKMARNKEQVDAAEKRIKKLREQLVAAEKIAVSGKKQFDNLREETLSLSHEIEQHQNAIRKLEVQIHIAQKNFISSANENGCGSENLQPTEFLSADTQSSDVKVSNKWTGNPVQGTTSCNVSSVNYQDSTGVAMPHLQESALSTGQAPQSSLDTELCNTKQTQLHNSTSMTAKAKMSHRLKRLKHLISIGAYKSESDMVSMKDKFVNSKLTSEAKRNEVGHSLLSTEQQILSRTVNIAFPDVSEQSVSQDVDLDLCTVIKPRISIAKSYMPTQQKTGGTSNDDLAVVSDKAGSGHVCSASLDEFTMPSDKKIKQILYHYNNSLDRNSSVCSLAPSSQLFVSDPVFSFQFPANATPSVTASLSAAGFESDALTIGYSYKPYHSSLLCFRSYRFSDFYHKEGLTVSDETFSHKLDCHTPLCQFDLMGKCLDENCGWQHRLDYSLSNREQLVDIVSYCPSVAGIDNSTPVNKYEQLINEYVEKFLKDTTQLPHSEQCLRLIDRVKMNGGLTYPHAVCTSARCWKLHRNRKTFSACDTSDFLFSLDDVSETCMHGSAVGCLATDDIRYWMVAESDQIKNLEEAVTDTPSDDSLWIKLAYAKMMEMKWCASHDEYISYGLNVLTRAVEANPSNSKLWTHYLDLYMLRSHAKKDISSLYEQAIQYAPSYEFFWKYLQLPLGYSQKMDICKRLRQYLCSPMCRDDADTRSHYLLQTVLYQAALCTMSGRFKDGLQVIQAIVQSKASVIWLTLTSCDRIIMWLSFIHLYECRQLPKMLFDPANGNPGPIVRKEAFVVPFQIGTKTRISYETLLQLFESAFSACDKDVKAESYSRDQYSVWLAALHRSRILLELSCHGCLAARHLAEQLLQRRPCLEDIWLLLVQLIVASSDNTTEDHTVSVTVSSTVEKALASNPHSVTLFLTGVCALIECGETDGALSFAERCPISLFEVDQLDATSVDPNLLYCCLLSQPVPLSYKTPALRSSVPHQYVADEQANLWLCYCLLLDLQGAHDQAVETYHLALSCLTRTKDVQRLWLAFLRRTAAVICRQLPWLSADNSLDLKRKLWQQFESDVDQALSSLPVRRCLPHSSQMWDDYSSHNEVIQLYVSCVSDVDVVQRMYEKYVHQMPGNAELALTNVSYLLSRDAVQLSRGLCLVALQSCPRSALLWNISLRLSQRTASVDFIRSVYAKATKMFPFSASLWKMYIMFEVINRSRGHVQNVLENCRRLQVNVAGFVDSLLK